VPADKGTKEARITAHAAFDRLWSKASKAGRTAARKRAYLWLQQQLGMTSEQCHIGKFSKEDCARVVVVCENPVGWPPKE